MSTSFRLKPEVKAYLEAKQNEWHQASLTDTLHKVVLDYKTLSEKAAAPAISPFSSSEPEGGSAPRETGPQQPSHPEKSPPGTHTNSFATVPGRGKRSFLEPSAVEVAYMKQKAIQKAKREGALERFKDREDFRRQAVADREEYEYALWKKRRSEKDRLSYTGPKVNYPGMG